MDEILVSGSQSFKNPEVPVRTLLCDQQKIGGCQSGEGALQLQVDESPQCEIGSSKSEPKIYLGRAFACLDTQP